MLRKEGAQPECPRQTLNEVLVAELTCLRSKWLSAKPGSAYGTPLISPSAASDSKIQLTPATYAARESTAPECAVNEKHRAINLREIYQLIGCWSEQARKGHADCPPPSALCLSGGGIRSATFNLGVLQRLARIGLLGKFDYISSVSGGGYIAAWLRAWMHRRTVQQVVSELGRGAKGCDPLATEPKPVSNLRDYSNYLTPKLGLFSGDTWAVAATIARNLLLNWLVLLPLLGAVIGIPLLFLMAIRTSGLPEGMPHFLLGLAVFIEVLASVLVYLVRRLAKNPHTSQGFFILLCVLPICLAALTLAAAGIGLNLAWAAPQPAPVRSDLNALWAFALLWSIGVPVFGWIIAEAIARLVPSARRATTGKGGNTKLSDQQIKEDARQVSLSFELLSLVVSGLVGASLFVGGVTWWFSYLYNHPALYAVLVLPLSLGSYLLSRVVFIGVASLNDEHGDPVEQGAAASAQTRLRSRISSNDADREWWSRLSGWLLLIIVSWVAVTGICLSGCYLPNVISALVGVAQENRHAFQAVSDVVKGIVTVTGLISGAIAAFTASSSKTPSHTEAQSQQPPFSSICILAVAGPLFVVCLIMGLSWGVKGLAEVIIDPSVFNLDFNKAGSQQPVPVLTTVLFAGLLAGLAAVSVIASRMSNVNRFSLQGMYRNRLVRAYLGASNCPIDGQEGRTPDPFTGFALNDNLPLHELCAERRTKTAPGGELNVVRPLSIINTTLNLVNGGNLAWQQRKAESFSMTPLFCGSWSEGYRKSKEYGGPGGITVGTAMGISGAAANPNMGYSSSPVLGCLMALFNLRLGAWLGNPNGKGDRTFARPGPRNAIGPLFAEMFGLTDSSQGYVNLSDGGHFDNLGLYEVVLRRCRQVLICDSGQDDSFAFEDLGNSIRKIRVDFGINIVFDRIKILPNTSKKKGLLCVIGRICYSDVDQSDSKDDGCLVYIKPTLRGRGTQVIPYDIYSYSRASTSFPHESTADQWFSESQFESYRALGWHIMEQLTEGLEEPKDAQNQADVDFAALLTSVNKYMTGWQDTATDGRKRRGASNGADANAALGAAISGSAAVLATGSVGTA